MKTITLKSIFALILFSILTFGLASIATSAGTNISNNGFEDSFPKTAGGYVVWQGKDGNDWEIFLYNANNGFGPVQITDNDYGDVNPETDGRYVTWASGAAPNGEIFLYDIATSTTIQITDYYTTDQENTYCIASVDPYPCCTGLGTGTCNAQYDHDPKIVDGVVVWVSHSEGVDTMYGPGDIMLYNAAYGTYENISKQIDPNNEHDDYAFRFDGNRIQWVQNTSGDMPNYVYDPITDSWGPVLNSYIRNYVYDLTTNKYYRYYIPDDEDLDFDAEYYVEDLTAGTAYIQTESPAVLVDQQSDGDFSVNAMWINGDREILLMDRQNKRGGFLTNNDIKDIQPAIKDNIVVWTGGEGNNSEIYLYTPLCPNDPNKIDPGQCGCGTPDTDTDNDNTADCKDDDDDNDGLLDVKEVQYKTDSLDPDTDNDGLYDGFEIYSTLTNPLLADSNSNGILDGDEDSDGDGFTNAEEFACNSNPGDSGSRCIKFLPFLMLLLD